MRFQHPLGSLTYKFDKKNSQKLKDWLSTPIGSLGAATKSDEADVETGCRG